MRKLILAITVLVVLWSFCVPENVSYPAKVFRGLLTFVQQRPQEKIYLHTDRDHYEAGEQVWLRAYLTNAVTHQASTLSRYVYVELRDRQDSLYARYKILNRDSVFEGFVPLDKKLSQGDYFLRAYSYWMQNAGDDYIFRKKIRVINPQDSKVLTEITYEDTDKGKVAKCHFYNTRQANYGKVYIEYVLGGKKKLGRTDDNGNLIFKVDSADYGKGMTINFKDGDPFIYEGTVYLPDPRTDFEVTFMPEGGDLLEGCQQTVAFKAIGTDGLSREVNGVVVDDKGEQVAFLQSLHKGMGAFDLNVEPGRRYFAVLKNTEEVEKRFELPLPNPHAIGLKLFSSPEILGYSVMAADSVQDSGDLYILVHSRGVPVLCKQTQIGAKGKLLMKDLPEGILTLALLNSKGEAYSQRLCFVHHNNRPKIILNWDKPFYHVREQVHLQVQVDADSIYAKAGSFSLAVTDAGKIERDSTQDHILSYLLLSSDIKGYIEDPAYYFKDERVATRRYLDLLMLTQGWTRFDLTKVLKQEYDSLSFYLERGQAISGRVKNFWGKNATQANLMLLSTSGMFRMVEADSGGYFMIDGIAFPDSTKFVIQGKSQKGRKSVEVLVDKDKFLSPTVKIPKGKEIAEKEDDFYKRFTKDYYYENGVKVYVLDEAVVKRKVMKKSYSMYDQMADYSLDSAKLASMADWDIRRVLEEFPGVEAWGDSVMRFGKSLYLMVNDFPESFDYVLNLQPRDLLSISYVRPPMSGVVIGPEAENGAIVITTNPNFVAHDKPKLNMVSFSMLGYQKKAEFYMPHYEVDSVRIALTDSTDQRSTIFWMPQIQTDQSGKADCYFTTSDSYGPYRVVIEGILNDGTVCRKEDIIQLKL